MKNLIEIQPLIDILQLTLQTAYLKPYNPNSLLVIAKPESAKTQAIMQTSNKENFVYYTNEMTAKMLIDEVLEKAKDKKIRFLCIPDILNCIEKQKSSREQFFNLIKSVIEEGITNIQTYFKRIESKQPIKIGLITAITTTSFSSIISREMRGRVLLQEKGIRKYLEETGILSRFIPFSYDYPIDKVKKIFNSIEGLETEQKGVKFKPISKKEEIIKSSFDMNRQLEPISFKLGQQYKAYGIRTQERLQNLAKANAKINNRKEVTQEDINKILELSKWINFDFNPI